MELTSDQFKLVNKFVQDWFKDKKLELETTFGIGGVVDSTAFLQIAQRLRNKGFEVIPQDDRLSIITPSHIRLSLLGLGVLQQYCKDDILEGKVFSAMFKDRAFPDSNIDLKEYNIRFKVRREEELSNDDPRVVALLANWERQKKAFRLIRRWTFRGKGIRIDMSMVRQTPTIPGKGEFQWSSTFQEKNVFKEVPRYEVEVELLHDTEYTDTPEKALKSLISAVGEVQRAIQKNTLLIRNSVIDTVRNEYKDMTNTDKFRGVNPVTLKRINMTEEINPDIINIRSGYNVTDKADGLRAMGFVNKQGELFLIDMSFNVYRTGLKNTKCAKSLVDGEWVTISKDGNSINHYLIFDIYHSKDGKNISRQPFVTYKDDIIDNESESRYNALRKWYDDWRDNTEVIAKGLTDATRLIISTKRFQFATPNNSTIFRACANILDTTRIYTTDGLIITTNSDPIPERSGVRWTKQFKWKPAKDNTVDFLINFERDPNIPTIDKITTTIHPSNENTVQFKTMRLYVGSDKDPALDNPRTTILLQEPIPKEKGASGRYKPSLFNPMEFPDTMANTCNVTIQTDPETAEEYVSTEDSNEPIQDRSIVEMRYDPSREPGWRWIPTRIRHDKTERLIRASLKKGPIKYSGMMNDEGVANDVWDSIHNPVTESMIRSGNEEPSEEESKIILKLQDTEVAKKYYERKAPKENISLIQGMLDFHNKYIKNEILLKRSLSGGNKHLLDLACGKGGDLFKWKFNGARYVVGVDTAGENITNPVDGAYKRYLDAIMEFGYDRVPKMVFVIGNSSRNIVNGEAGSTPEERDILRSVFGRFQPEGSVPKYVQNVMAGSYRAGADVAACMFALHYFFENKVTLDGFIKNLSESVKIGGLFIGCCFDGDKVFNLLRTVEKGRSKVGKIEDTPIWTITKDYDKEELLPDDDSIGLAIDVEFMSIGTTHKEYLVPFELLKKKLKGIGFELLDKKDLMELGLNTSTNTFDVSYEMSQKGKRVFTIPDTVKEFSFLNRWFIFKRIGEVGISEMPKIVLPDETLENTVEEAKRNKQDQDDGEEQEQEEGEQGNEKDGEEQEEEKTVVSETGAKLPPRDKKFSEVEVFRFGIDARQADILGIKDDKGKKDLNIGRWLGLAAPFPIPDPDDASIKYPSIEHYLAGMKLKVASNKPQMAKDLMSTTGKIHQDFALKRRAEAVKQESARDFELLAEEATDVRKKMTKTYLNSSRTVINEDKWIPVKDKFLMDALKYRFDKDKRFRDGVEAARNAGKYLLYTTKIAAVASELGGTRSLSSSIIEGENKVGRFIMELAGFKF
jgi:mRNA (guanine-N7-)-methyltransferase